MEAIDGAAILARIDQAEMRLVEHLQRLEKAVDNIGTHKPPPLWGIPEIAEWLNVSEVTVKIRTIKLKDFPEPVSPSGSTEGMKRWFADEVIAFGRNTRVSAERTAAKRQA